MISDRETINISDATIIGDLDLTTMDQKYKGGRYGLRKGIAQEYFTRVQAPVNFSNCTFTGSLITKSEVVEGRITKENYSSINAPVTFADCVFQDKLNFQDMRIKETLSFTNCKFEKAIKFSSVHFEKTPIFENNQVKSGFVNTKTNWEMDKSTIEIPEPYVRNPNLVMVELKNPTMKDIEIIFNGTKWTLSPKGTSGLEREAGTQIYLLEDRKKRLILTLDKSMDQSVVDVSKL